MNDHNPWLIWQLVDATFPTGAFAHSGGLESAAHARFIANLNELEAFLDASLTDLAHSQLPLLTAAHTQPARVPELDNRCQALLTNHVASRASRAQGQAMLTAAASAFDEPNLDTWRAALRRDQLRGHLAPLFGGVTAALDLDIATSKRLFLYATLRDLLSAAVRLDRLGPLQAQAMQYRLSPQLDRYAQMSADLDAEDACQTAPLLDILHGRHDQLAWRLFHS